MTKLIDQAIEAIRKLPPGRQDDVARYVLMLADETPVSLTPEEEAAIAEAEAEIARGEFASPEEMKAFWQSRGV